MFLDRARQARYSWSDAHDTEIIGWIFVVDFCLFWGGGGAKIIMISWLCTC